MERGTVEEAQQKQRVRERSRNIKHRGGNNSMEVEGYLPLSLLRCSSSEPSPRDAFST